MTTPDPVEHDQEPSAQSDGGNVGSVEMNPGVTGGPEAQEMRARLAAIVESSEDPIIGKTLEGIITNWNPAAERLYGYSAQEAVGQPITILAPPDRPDEISEILEKVRRGEKVARLETVRRSKDGRRIDVSLTVSPIKDAADSIVGASTIARDITERKRAEEALRRSERNLAAAQRIAHLGSWEWNMTTGEQRWSDEVYRIAGYEPGEIASTYENFLSCVHPEDREYVQGEANEALREGKPYDFEHRIVRPDGTERVVREQAEIEFDRARQVQLAGTVHDITEQKRAEERLREKEAQYRSVFETTGDGLVITDLDGNLVDANPAFYQMHGYDSRDELADHHVTTWIHPDHHSLFGEYAATIRGGGRFQAQAVDVCKDGSPFPVEIHGSAFTYRSELHILWVVWDVTERMRAYELLERRVEERTRELSTLLEVSNNVASTLELEPLLGLILDQLRAVVDCTDSSLLVFEGQELVTVGYRGPVPQEQIMGTRFPPERGRMMWEEFGHLEPIVIDDVRSDAPLARAYRQVVGEERLRKEFRHIRSWLGVPLVFKGQPIGLLAIIHDKPGHYTERHAELARTMANQAVVAIENARFYERAQSAAAIEERQRLARELHDSVSQALYGIRLGSDAALTLLDSDPARAGEPLQYVRSLAEAGLAEMRALIFELRPESLENEGLIVALEKQVASLQARHGIEVQADLRREPDVTVEAKEALYRVAQEALNNTVKHAQASRVELKLECDANGVTLWVSDDGVGFDPAGSFPGHLGLKSMRERTERLGGTLEVTSETGKGTRLRAWIPSRR